MTANISPRVMGDTIMLAVSEEDITVCLPRNAAERTTAKADTGELLTALIFPE